MPDIDAHSRLIAWLKIVLPFTALAILSTLFLVSRQINPEDAIPYADVDVEDRLREPRMTSPTYAGMTTDGAALTISAAEARPDQANANSGTAQDVVGRLETPDGTRTDVQAGSARIENDKRMVYFTNGVTIAQNNGWTVSSQELAANLDKAEFMTDTEIQAKGPAGTLTADSLRLTEDPLNTGQYLLVFNGRVKLIYQPPN